jgi:uncharacterized protein with HEPN domain
LREDELRLADILESLERIREFTTGGRESFFGDTKTQDAVAYEILKVGEAAARATPEFRKRHDRVPWLRLTRLRNSVVHEYFRLDLEAVWIFITEELDEVEESLRI